jgi:hypothetical protein
MATLTFDVILNRKVIDTVFYTFARKQTRAELEEDIYRSLVGHDGYDSGIKVRLMTRLTTDEYDLEADYGHGEGWEVVTSEPTRKAARIRKAEYIANDSQPAAYRIVHHRVSIFAD